MKLLSIIIPIYNMEKYLPECLSSLNRQGFDESVEIILVDDGSEDNSLQLCKNAADLYGFYKIIHQDNKGVASARNTGLMNAKGKYIAWVDPDDYITDDWWIVIKKELIKNPEMIYFDMYLLCDNKLQEVNYDKKSRNINHRELCVELSLDQRLQSHLWSKIILRDYFDRFFSNKYSYCEDFALLHYIVCKVNVCQYVHKPLYVYRQLENSIVHNNAALLNNYLVEIKLCKMRFRFFYKMNIDVPYDGVWNTMLAYCFEYAKHSSDYCYIQQKEINSVCTNILRHNIFKIISSKYFTFKHKIRFVIAALGCINLFYMIKNDKSS